MYAKFSCLLLTLTLTRSQSPGADGCMGCKSAAIKMVEGPVFPTCSEFASDGYRCAFPTPGRRLQQPLPDRDPPAGSEPAFLGHGGEAKFFIRDDDSLELLKAGARCPKSGSGAGFRTTVDLRQGHPEGVPEGQVCCSKDHVLPMEMADTSSNFCADFEGFSCVPQHTCRNSQLLSDGNGDVLRFDPVMAVVEIRPGGSKCRSSMEVCCKTDKTPSLEDLSNADTTMSSDDVARGSSAPAAAAAAAARVTVPEDSRARSIKGDADIKGDNTLSVVTAIKDEAEIVEEVRIVQKDHYRPRCGRRNADGLDIRILDENASAQFGEWPFMCAIFATSTSTESQVSSIFVAGGSLLAPGVVLTVAHWVYDLSPESLSVRCGEWDMRRLIELRPHQDRRVERISVHPSFDQTNVYNDVALLHLSTEFLLDEHIDTVCLPPEPNDRSTYSQNSCVATGWGKDTPGGSYQHVLKMVDLAVMPNDKCQENLRTYTRLNSTFVLHDSFLCAGGQQGVDTCQGDGGGPLVCLAKDGVSYIQAGITAWGIGCGRAKVPGVYASVADGLCFIDWATRCNHGDLYKPYYDYSSKCAGWIDEEIARLAEIKSYSQDVLQNFGDKMDRVQRGRYEKVNLDAAVHIKRAQTLKSSCRSGLTLAGRRG